ncbi:MAG TPA: shikimate dehydrogenase [Allosphingosinicella sp.]|jgi:shikimate dehydrogenase
MGVPYAEVIGDPIAHSKSPLIHKFWLGKLGLEGDYRRTLVPSRDLGAHLQERRRDPDWSGCNVTSPHKVDIVELLDGLFPEAKAAGAVNLVKNHRGTLLGSNSDLRGFAEPFRSAYSERGTAALIGAGGAARAAFIALAGLNFDIVHVANRTPGKAEAMLRSLNQEGLAPCSLEDPIPAVDLLVNASAIGGPGNDFDFDLSGLPDDAIVYDIVYSPLETPLLAAARSRGLRTIDGLSMLIGQAAAAFVYFFDGIPPREHDPELRELLTR